jgi:serine phosphatase RsbU (regulator of sigma subunit)
MSLFLFFNFFLDSETKAAQDNQTSIHLKEDDWIFIPDDNESYKFGVFDNARIFYDNPAGPWQVNIPEVSDYGGIGWYIHEVTIGDLNPQLHYGISIPFSYSGYQLFFNGKMLYESKTFNQSENASFGNPPIIIDIPSEMIKKNNIISLRVLSYINLGGFGSNGLERPFITIDLYNEMISQHSRFILQYSAIGFISIFLFVFFIFRYILRKKDIYNLYFALMSLSVGIFLLGYYGFLLYLFYKPWAYWLLTFIAGVSMYLTPVLFINSFFNLKNGIIAKIFIGFYIFLDLLVFIEYITTGRISFFMNYFYDFFNLSYIPLVVYLIVIGAKALRNKLEYAGIMFSGILLLGLTFVYSMLCFIGIINYTPLVGEGFFLMVVIFSFALAKRFAQTHINLETAHHSLLQATDEIKALNLNLEAKVRLRTAELQEKNNEITESIEYASLIQHSVHPSQEDLRSVLSDYFIIWRPRDIVGGDLYWMNKDNDGFLLAVIDCTGHGVPGSLLTMTATATLDHVANQMKIYNPSRVLEELNRIMKTRLNQGDSNIYADDGMEIALIRYDDRKKSLQFSSSRINLYMVDKGELTEYKADRQGIGYKRSDADFQFTLYDLPCTSSTKYYLTTDGYIEQSGGKKRFGFGWTRFKKLLTDHRDSTMEEMKTILEDAFDDYRSELSQRDDVLVFGFQLLLTGK